MNWLHATGSPVPEFPPAPEGTQAPAPEAVPAQKEGSPADRGNNKRISFDASTNFKEGDADSGADDDDDDNNTRTSLASGGAQARRLSSEFKPEDLEELSMLTAEPDKPKHVGRNTQRARRGSAVRFSSRVSSIETLALGEAFDAEASRGHGLTVDPKAREEVMRELEEQEEATMCVVPFSTFKQHGSLPRSDKQLARPAIKGDLIVFISHRCARTPSIVDPLAQTDSGFPCTRAGGGVIACQIRTTSSLVSYAGAWKSSCSS